VNFEVGMVLVSYSVSGYDLHAVHERSSRLRGRNQPLGRHRDRLGHRWWNGRTPTNWSTSFPYLGVQGDVAHGCDLGYHGLLQDLGPWRLDPDHRPGSSDSFWGVDRSADVTRLGGVRFNGASESIEEALIDGASSGRPRRRTCRTCAS
jgi:hypothetical protein